MKRNNPNEVEEEAKLFKLNTKKWADISVTDIDQDAFMIGKKGKK